MMDLFSWMFETACIVIYITRISLRGELLFGESALSRQKLDCTRLISLLQK
jgi:hypothetical protein